MPTFRGAIIDRQILLTVHVSRPSTNSARGSKPAAFRALLDTGATISSISGKVVEALGLAPDSWRPIAGVHGTVDMATFTVDLSVPISEPVSGPGGERTRTTFSRGAILEVALLNIQPAAFDVLLGMDILEGFHLTVHADRFILSS